MNSGVLWYCKQIKSVTYWGLASENQDQTLFRVMKWGNSGVCRSWIYRRRLHWILGRHCVFRGRCRDCFPVTLRSWWLGLLWSHRSTTGYRRLHCALVAIGLHFATWINQFNELWLSQQFKKWLNPLMINIVSVK